MRVTRWLSFFLSFLSWPITFSVLVLLPQTDTAARKVVGVESRPREGGRSTDEHGGEKSNELMPRRWAAFELNSNGAELSGWHN